MRPGFPIFPPVRRVLAAVLLLAFQAIPARAAEAFPPAPMPPPPELLGDLSGPGAAAAPTPYQPGDPASIRQALEPPPIVPPAVVGTPPPALPTPPASAAGAAAPPRRRFPLSDLAISPPASHLPTEYYEPPLDDWEVPGVVLPEIDDSYLANPALRVFPPGRPASPGLSPRQLAPFLALAKGSEATAIEARRINDEEVFREQLDKAVSAYLDIIAMADAGHEAREEAWYGVARCEYRRGNWWKAFDALERSFPAGFERSEVNGRIRLEMFIGERLWRMGGEAVPDAASEGGALNGWQASSKVYAAVVFNQPSAQDAPLALLRRGDAAAMEEDWEAAAKFYRQVVDNYPESDSAMQARSSLAETVLRRYPEGMPEAARADLGLIMDDVERGDSGLSEEAEERRRRAVSMANGLEAEARLRQAREYLRNVRVAKSRDAAVFLLGDVVSRFPGTSQAGEAAGILRGMGIEPPLVLSDGSRFPMTSGWSGRGDDAASGTIFPEGRVDLGIQDNREGSAAAPE